MIKEQKITMKNCYNFHAHNTTVLVGSKSIFLIYNSVADPDPLESASFCEARSKSGYASD
jgi:hypothetical protein